MTLGFKPTNQNLTIYFVYIHDFALLIVAQWHNSCGWWYLRLMKKFTLWRVVGVKVQDYVNRRPPHWLRDIGLGTWLPWELVFSFEVLLKKTKSASVQLYVDLKKIKVVCWRSSWRLNFLFLGCRIHRLKKKCFFFVLYSWSLHSTKQKIREDRQIRFLTYKWISASRLLASWKQGNFFQLFLPCECFAWFLFPKCIWTRNFICHLS